MLLSLLNLEKYLFFLALLGCCLTFLYYFSSAFLRQKPKPTQLSLGDLIAKSENLVRQANKLYGLSLKIKEENLLESYERYTIRLKQVLQTIPHIYQTNQLVGLRLALEECHYRGVTLNKFFTHSIFPKGTSPTIRWWEKLFSPDYCFICNRKIYFGINIKILLFGHEYTPKAKFCFSCRRGWKKILLSKHHDASHGNQKCGKDVRSLELVYSRSKPNIDKPD